ncbi:MAG: hypothetical protein J0I41_18840 [Filimonas sp.]|nr:hypothetical protein [Filimonas sp.]
MKKITATGTIMFSLGMIALAIISFLSQDFIVGRPPAWPGTLHINPLFAYLSGSILIILSVAVLLRKQGYRASLSIALVLFLCSVLRHLPQFMADWLNSYKSIALMGGALIIAAAFTSKAQNRQVLILTGSLCLAAFFISAGYAHFKFAAFVKDFIPAYIPAHSFFTYFCGICLVAGGIGLFIPALNYWAALLSGIMVLGWFILLHIPRFMANMNDASDRMGLCESFAMAGVFFVLAGLHAKSQSSVENTKKAEDTLRIA